MQQDKKIIFHCATRHIIQINLSKSNFLNKNLFIRSPSPENKQARFQTMDDGDIRDLGVGYFSFSRDENERQKQMSLLG